MKPRNLENLENQENQENLENQENQENQENLENLIHQNRTESRKLRTDEKIFLMFTILIPIL